jgi:hypothetical protein
MEKFDFIKILFLLFAVVIIMTFAIGTAFILGYEEGTHAIIDSYNLHNVLGG